MRKFLTFLAMAAFSIKAQADVETDKKTQVSCEGEVIAFTANAEAAMTSNGICEWSDRTKIKLKKPKEWENQVLEVISRSLPDNHPLRSKGNTIKFKIAKIYLVREYKRADGKTDQYIPGELALEIKDHPNKLVQPTPLRGAADESRSR